MIRNIIFDWSGTLVDDLPAVWEASNEVFRNAGKPEMTLDDFRSRFSLPFRNFYEDHLPGFPLDQLESWFHAAFHKVQDSVVELPHARQFLKFCRQNNIRTFLLSTIHPKHFAAQADSTGFHEFIDVPYVEVWDKRGKIHEVLETNNLRPHETVFIGDMQHDIETAHHGGIFSCAVLTGYNNFEQLQNSRPNLLVEHLGELQAFLERNHMQWPVGLPETTPRSELPIATVGGLLFNENNRVLMLRTHKWSNRWGIPGGKIQWGETSEQALRREIFEETGLSLDSVRFFMLQDCIRPDEFFREAHFILLNYVCAVKGDQEVRLNEEAQSYQWTAPEEALHLPLNSPTRILLRAVLASSEPAVSHPSDIVQ